MGVSDEEAADALRWITRLVEGAGITFQAVGGLAARAYGADRPIVDLDFYVLGEDFEALLVAAGDACVWGPERYRDNTWDLTFARLRWGGVPIEVADATGAQYFDRIRNQWITQDIDFHRSETRTVLGTPIPVMPKAQLVAYKKGLARSVDLQDLKEMAGRRRHET